MIFDDIFVAYLDLKLKLRDNNTITNLSQNPSTSLENAQKPRQGMKLRDFVAWCERWTILIILFCIDDRSSAIIDVTVCLNGNNTLT